MHHQNPQSLSTMLKCAGRFLYIRMTDKIQFHKPYTNPQDLVSLLQSRGLTITDTARAERYLCCHHARVWNKQNTIRPMIPNSMNGKWITIPTDTLRVYFDLCIIKYFLNIISPQNDMRDKITKLMSDFPDIDPNAMGFTSGWQNEPLWQ